jgi:hypothetical protein
MLVPLALTAATLLQASPGEGPSLEADSVPVARAASCIPQDRPSLNGAWDPEVDLLRIREVAGEGPRASGAGSLHRGSAREAGWARDCPLRVHLLPVSLTTRNESGYPGAGRDGPLWAGRGWSGMLETGVSFRRGPVSGAVRPQVVGSENEGFDHAAVSIPGFGPFIYPWHATQIDWPLRHGSRSFREVHPGESYLRYDGRGFGVGLSTERLRWGPARRNPLIMGPGAPGFPHLFVGTSAPASTLIGEMEVEAVWGRLSASEHFDVAEEDGHRLFGGLLLQLRPRGAEDLHIGVTHAHVENLDPLDGSGVGFLTRPFLPRDRELGRLDRLQLGSVFFRYVVPDGGTEFYGEWGRRDLWADVLRFKALSRGDAGFTFGFQHVRSGESNRVRIHGELTSLRTTRALVDGGRPLTFYVHSRVRHGYTHRGRLLGAPIGPGSDAQTLGVDLIFPRSGHVGLMAERVRRDDDAFFRVWAPFLGYRGHDVELTVAAPFGLRWQNWEARGSVSHSWRRNRNFTGLFRGVSTEDILKERNQSLHLSLIWRP